MTQYLIVSAIFTLLLSAKAYSLNEWEEMFGSRPSQWVLSHVSLVLFIIPVLAFNIVKVIWEAMTFCASGGKRKG